MNGKKKSPHNGAYLLSRPPDKLKPRLHQKLQALFSQIPGSKNKSVFFSNSHWMIADRKILIAKIIIPDNYSIAGNPANHGPVFCPHPRPHRGIIPFAGIKTERTVRMYPSDKKRIHGLFPAELYRCCFSSAVKNFIAEKSFSNSYTIYKPTYFYELTHLFFPG